MLTFRALVPRRNSFVLIGSFNCGLVNPVQIIDLLGKVQGDIWELEAPLDGLLLFDDTYTLSTTGPSSSFIEHAVSGSIFLSGWVRENILFNFYARQNFLNISLLSLRLKFGVIK